MFLIDGRFFNFNSTMEKKKKKKRKRRENLICLCQHPISSGIIKKIITNKQIKNKNK